MPWAFAQREEACLPMHRAEAWKGMAMSERASTRIDRDGRLLKALRRREPAAAELLVATQSRLLGALSAEIARAIRTGAQTAGPSAGSIDTRLQ